jgi:hypothetical protein
MMVTSLNKSDVLSIVVDSTRNKIIRRLDEAGKAAYSDLLDSADHIRYLTSTGNFNYHLSFLLKNSMIVKKGMVYKLTPKGREIARFVKDVDQIWSRLESTLRGENMSIFSCAEQFENETGIKMQKTTLSFHGTDMILDDRRVIGIMTQKGSDQDFFASYEQLRVEGFKLCVKNCDKEGKKSNFLVLSHSDLSYSITPDMLGAVYQYLERNFGEAFVFASKEKPGPFLFRAREMGKDYNGCAFLVAPCVF